MKRKSHILLFLGCLVFFSSWGQQFENIQFIENKGQWDEKIRFKGSFAGGAIFLQRNGFSVLQHNPEDYQRLADKMHGHMLDPHASNLKQNDSLTIRSHVYEAQFLGANPQANIVADKPIVTYNNYFIGNDPSKWAVNCKIYQGVTIQNLYPNVDLRYYSNNGLMKYDLIVKPGGNVSQIALQYKGVEKLTVKNKELIAHTSVGPVKELDPYSYQYSAKGKQVVPCKYIVQGNTVRFEVKNYDPKTTLVIDPTLIFSSFSGSAANNWGFTATYGPDGSMYGGGIVEGTGFPVSPGAYQSNYGGGAWDIGVMKLTPDGSTRVYGTYIGGSGIEQPHSLVVDGQGNLVIAGRSNSPDYPSRGLGHLGAGLGYDIIVTKLNATGTDLIGSFRIGGSNDDGVNISPNRHRSSLQYNYGDDGRSEVILDGGNNIYVASSTRSADFPVVGGFKSALGGEQDAVVIKLNPDLTAVAFSTYLGGTHNDAAYVLAINPHTNNIYVGGGTESTDIANTSGSKYSSNRGGIDGFVSIISNNGSSLIRTTYMGTSGYDQVYGVQFDREGFPYVMGQTTGAWEVNAPWSQAGGKQFIVKMQPDLSAFVYSTVFGTGGNLPNISPTAFLVDRCENVYVSGWGGDLDIAGTGFDLAGTAGLSTVNPLQPTTDGDDFYFFVLKRDAAAQLYGDFFGQRGGFIDHVDGGTSRFDANGVIYQALCANCGGGVRFPTTPNAWATTNGALNGRSVTCNLAMIKIDLELSGVRSGVQPSINGVPRDSSGCVPLTVDFRDTVLRAVSYEWYFGDGTPMVPSTAPNMSHTYPQIGKYHVMLVAIDPNSCNLRDTSYTTITVGNLQATADFNPVKLPPCEAFKYQFDNTSVAPAGRPFTATSFVWDFGDGSPQVPAGAGPVLHEYTTAGSYNVRLYLVDTAYCNAPDSEVKVLNVAALVKARFETPPTGCAPYNAAFTNTSDGGQQFFWDFGDGSTSTEPSPTHLYLSPGTYTIRLRVVDPNTCNKEDQTSSSITIYSLPTADFSVAPQPPIVNTPINFTNLSSADAVRFKWVFGDGDSMEVTTKETVQHEYNTTGKFDACLIVFNANNCSDTVCKTVEALVEPAVDVPNAFTPLSGDANSKIFVRGYGIKQLHFIIWNRWGQKVFETENLKQGWDGRFKGAVQPMETYFYTLEVNFTDGTSASKRGDITLIR